MIGIAVTGVSILGYITYSMFVNTTDTTQDMATSQPDQKESFNANQSAEQEVETKESISITIAGNAKCARKALIPSKYPIQNKRDR